MVGRKGAYNDRPLSNCTLCRYSSIIFQGLKGTAQVICWLPVLAWQFQEISWKAKSFADSSQSRQSLRAPKLILLFCLYIEANGKKDLYLIDVEIPLWGRLWTYFVVLHVKNKKKNNLYFIGAEIPLSGRNIDFEALSWPNGFFVRKNTFEMFRR